jgi:tetratricopeptide (TPR) repeat protein
MRLRGARPLDDPPPVWGVWRWHLPCFCPGPTATIERNPLERRLTVKRALLLLPLLLVPGPSPAAEKASVQEVKFGIEVAQKGMWREALFRFQKAVEIDPQNPSALNDLAVALEQVGEFQEARENYERALELKPDDLYIQQNYDLFREADDKRNRKKRTRSR